LTNNILELLLGREEEVFGRAYFVTQGEKIISNLPLPLVVCDKVFLILSANPAFTRLFKVHAEELKGRNLFQILGNHKITLLQNGKEYQQITSLSMVIGHRNPKVLQGEFPKIGKRVFHLLTRKMASHVLILFQDMTEIKAWEDKVSTSRHELLSVFDGVEEPMVMIDKNLKIRRFNKAMLESVEGSNYQAFLGGACYFKLHGRKSPCPECTAPRTFRTGKKSSRFGLLENHSQAEERQYHITCYPLRSSAGKVIGVAESYRDVTEVRQIEAELYESERRRIMEPLAAGIAHEVRNPLAIIRSTAQYCLSEVNNDESLAESLQRIIKSAENANQVINDLVNFSRPEPINFERQPLEPLLKEGLDLVRGRAKTQKVYLFKSITGNLPELFLDKKRFLQAYINFLMNALDAMPQGGKLGVQVHQNGDHRGLRLIIRDSGEGIPEELISKISQPFYSTKKSGMGLGLPIAEGIVRSHGGYVDFKSQPGQGTTVTIFLPVKKRPEIYAYGNHSRH